MTISVSAQNVTVKGNVKEASGEPVIGATVLQTGTTSNGTVTDINGNGWQDKYMLLPFPSEQLSANPNLKQNPGW
ncbi:MAG: RagB/SusD family nutrient uptake outer membrane protein [Bacteroidales bacterium]|nr:RagB/SusD family nutrient uptake outer membrane protein [Bacteroidales bacterium]